MTRILATIMIGLFLAGCGKHYWQAPGRGISEFQTDSGQCNQEAKSKYEVSERIYRRCMQAQGWKRIQTHYPSNSQFRGPEDEDEFFSPPNPLSERGVEPSRADDPTCMGPTVTRPSHCTRSDKSSDRAAARAVGPGPTQSTTQEITSVAAKLKALIGTWSGTVYAQRATYPLTTTFRDDGSWHATSPTLRPGTFDGTWWLNGKNVVWASITTGRTGTATLHEANGTRILRLIPDDGSSTIELTPAP